MNTNNINKKILVIYGPNINFIGHMNFAKHKQLTLDKLNKILKKEAKIFNYNIKIFQTNFEGKAVTLIQRQRNKIIGVIIFPGPWQKSGYAIDDVLKIFNIPFITISTGEKTNVLNGILNIKNNNLILACKKAVKKLINLNLSK